MKKNFLYGGIGAVVAVSVIILIFALQSSDNSKMSMSSEIQQEKIIVYASFFPYYEFAKNVAGDKAIVKQYLPSGIEAHNWEPRAGEIQSLQDADVFVYAGLGIEPYVDNLIDSGEFDHIVFIKASNGIELLKFEDHKEQFLEEIGKIIEEFEEGQITELQTLEFIKEILHEHVGDGHDHGKGIIEEIEEFVHQFEEGEINALEGIVEIHHLVSGEDVHAKDGEIEYEHDTDGEIEYEHDTDGEIEDEHGHSFEYDPHIWLDPILVKQQVNNIKDELVKVDPENANYYEQNAVAYNAQLDTFDAKVRSEISNCQKDTFVPFHNAFTYFGERYDLTVFAIGGLTPDSEASASEIAEFVNFVKDNDIKVLFAEELVDPRLAQVIADEAGAQVLIFSPLEALTPVEASKGVTFLQKMEQNLDVLKVALECQ